MQTKILSGREAADALLASLKDDVARLNPKLVVVQVGDDPASASYIAQKIKSCDAVGMRHEHKHLPEMATKEELFALVRSLNEDDDVTGFFVQLPLPKHLQSHVTELILAINPRKDIDGFHRMNIGGVFLGTDTEQLPPATPAGVVYLLEHFGVEIAGKHAVVLGRSNTVGKPVAVMLLNRHATVSVCHSKTPDVGVLTRQADILIAAVGKPKFVTKDMVKAGATVVDVGIHRTETGLVGDTDFAALQGHVSAITPVPGGVGPMTVAALIRNCVNAAKLRQS